MEKHAGNRSGKDEPANRFCCQSSYLQDNGVPSSSRILRPNISLETRQRNATNENDRGANDKAKQRARIKGKEEKDSKGTRGRYTSKENISVMVPEEIYP